MTGWEFFVQAFCGGTGFALAMLIVVGGAVTLVNYACSTLPSIEKIEARLKSLEGRVTNLEDYPEGISRKSEE